MNSVVLLIYGTILGGGTTWGEAARPVPSCQFLYALLSKCVSAGEIRRASYKRENRKEGLEQVGD